MKKFIANVNEMRIGNFDYPKLEGVPVKPITQRDINKMNKKPVEKFDYSKLPNGLIEHGRRGVTNAQMIPAIKKAIDNNDIEGLKTLKSNFPMVFESTIKYLKKEYKEKVNTLVA